MALTYIGIILLASYIVFQCIMLMLLILVCGANDSIKLIEIATVPAW